MYLDKLSTQERVVVISRQVINTGEVPLYLDKLSRHQGRPSSVLVSRQAINLGEGWGYLDKLSRHRGGVGCI